MAKKGFNLLRPQLSPPTAWDKVYQWMVGTARIIIIIVQVIVISAFGARIVLDTMGKQLDKDIKAKDAALEAYKLREVEFKQIQIKADLYKEVWEQSSNTQVPIAIINDLIASYNGLITLSVGKNTIAMNGELPTKQIGTLEGALKDRIVNSSVVGIPEDQKIFESIELVYIDSDGTTSSLTASFSIKITLPDNPKPRTI